jgi:lysozyme
VLKSKLGGQTEIGGRGDGGWVVVYSKAGLALTESFEGVRLVAYQDQVGRWTIGYGHAEGVHEGDTCTQEQAEQWLEQDVQWAESVVNNHVTIPLTQTQFDALVDFVFNVGSGNFEHSSLLELVNTGDFEQAAQQFEKWSHAGGVVVAGLLRRRIAEEQEFSGK